MPDWKERFAALGLDFEERVDALKLRLRQRAGSFENLQLIPTEVSAIPNGSF
jgi:hypothetical protein